MLSKVAAARCGPGGVAAHWPSPLPMRPWSCVVGHGYHGCTVAHPSSSATNLQAAQV